MTNKQLYDQWFERWSLVNEKPKLDQIEPWLPPTILGVNFATLLLSGSRTATVIAKTKTFEGVPEILQLADSIYYKFSSFEMIVGLLGVEGALFVSGYLMGKKWGKGVWVHYTYFVSAFLIAITANITPAFQLLGYKDFWVVVVNVVVGIFTVVLSVLGGSVLSTLKHIQKEEFNTKLSQWEQIRKGAWERSSEYRILRSELNIYKKQNKEKSKKPLTEQIIGMLKKENKPIKLDLLISRLGADDGISLAINELKKDNKITANGDGKIKLVLDK
jgi:hypothetical protein